MALPERDYDEGDASGDSTEKAVKVTVPEQKHHPDTSQKDQTVCKNSDPLYQNGLILSSVRNLPVNFEESVTSVDGRHGSQTTIDSNYDINDVANELIRLSEEQQLHDAQL